MAMVKRKLGSVGGGAIDRDSIGGQHMMSQVFLRNLPLKMLEPDMETMLADCGPIKRIDLIKTTDAETGAKKSRGFGFVTFALKDDATKAVKTIHGRRVMGREISCEIALKKGSKREGRPAGDGRKDPAVLMENLSETTVDREEATASSTPSASGVGGGQKISTINIAPACVEIPADVEKNAKGARVQAVVAAAKSYHEQRDTTRIRVEGKPSKVSGKRTEQPAAGAEAGAGLSKKESRKIAKKAAKKEIKERAKERARKKKAAQAVEEPHSPEGMTPASAGRGEVGEASAGGDDNILDPKAVKLKKDARTVLVFGVAEDLSAKQLLKRIKKCATVSSLDLEENERRYYPAGRIARVACAAKEGTKKVIAGVDGHTVHGQTLRVRRLMEIIPGDDVRQQKQQRLIVRNLNFLAKENDLVKAFSEFGPLSEVHIPTVRVTSQKRIQGTGEQETVTRDRSRGFGFVQFLCPKDASRVVKDHGVLKICGRDVAVDYSITKDKYDTLRHVGTEEAGTTPVAERDTDNNRNAEEADRDPAADEADVEETDVAMDVASDESDSDAEGNTSEREEEGGPDAAAGVGRGRGPERIRREPDVQQGCTVFVRNVAFDCGQEEVKDKFGEFGIVRLALLVKDRATGMPRGTAFVKFSNKDEADRCLAAAIGVSDPTHARDSGGSCIFLGSRALHVTRAVDRDEAGRLTVGAQKRKGHKDKRNIYLANEGLVLEDSAAAEGAAKLDMDKRAASRRDKKTKLKNPLFFVSPVRLSVRNLAQHVTDGQLKAMAAAAARAGIEAGRATPQDVRLYLEAQGEEFAVITPKRLQIPSATLSSVVKVKIIRDMDKKPSLEDPSQLHPSKGYGFVEFAHHGQALAALRQMNNNPAFSGLARSEGASKGGSSRLFVEFSVENHAKLKLQQSRKEAFELRKRELKALGLGQDGRPMKERETTNKSRGKNQREKKKQIVTTTGGEALTPIPKADAKQSLETGRTVSESKKRKKRGEEAEGDDRRGGRRVPMVGSECAGVDGDGDLQVGDEEDRIRPRKASSSRRKKQKKANRDERVDGQERAYQKLEKAYTAKTEAVVRAKSKGAKNVADKGGLAGRRGEQEAGWNDAVRNGKQGDRWFDSA